MESISSLIKGARLIIETCLRVEEGENLLIISDSERRAQSEAMAGVAFSLGAYPAVIDIDPIVRLASASYSYPIDPPRHLAQAMKSSDTIIFSTCIPYAHRIPHVDAIKESCAAGAKVCSVEEGMPDWDITEGDVAAVVERTEKIIRAMEGAERVRVTSPGGTDVSISIKGRRPLRIVPVKEKGEMIGPIPLWGEVAWAAIEDKAEGTIVIDGIMLGVGVTGTISEPIRWEVKGGRAIELTGGSEAKALKALLSSSDNNANIVAEFAIGTGHKESFGSFMEKGKLGTVHFALGDNFHCYPGGQSLSRYHLDGSIRGVTIEVDGKVIMAGGGLEI